MISDSYLKALDIANQKYLEKFGENAKLKNGEKIVTCFKNCTLILSKKDNNIEIKFIGGKAYESDYEVPMFKSKGEN